MTDNYLVKPDAFSGFDNLSTEESLGSINIDLNEFEQFDSNNAN